MSKIKLVFFYFSPVLIFFANDIVRNIRPFLGQSKYVFLSLIFGWLPNYLAALGFVLLGQICLKFYLEISGNKNYRQYIYKFMGLIVVVTTAGLIWWEFEQKIGQLVFDKNDIYATIGGALTGYLFFFILARNDFFLPKEK